MLASELAQQLTTKFKLVCFEDLADVVAQHSTVFQLFKSLHKECYEDSERLVFYTTHEPNQSQLDHVQRAAARVDISNFFILIVCPFDIGHKLQKANQQFGYDDSVMQNLVLPVQQTKQFGPSRLVPIQSLCALPFVQANIGADGNVRPCCKFQGSIGNLSTASLEQIWNDTKIEMIRQQMRDGLRPEPCSICWQNQDAGTTSYRQLAWKKYGAAMDHGWLDDVQIRDISWAPSSLCNFTCRICSEISSTSIAVEEIKFAQDAHAVKAIKHIMSITNDPAISDKVSASISQLANVEHLHVMGGEPFLWPGLPRLVADTVAKSRADRITLELHTNCSVFPEDKIQLIIGHFRAVQILLSVDNIGTRFEIERGSQWDLILANIKKFAALKSDRCEIKLIVTVNLQNILYLDQVMDFARSMDLSIIWWYLEDPACLSIDNATEALKNLVSQKYRDHSEPELRLIAQRVSNAVGSDGQEFLAWCDKLDGRRNQRFADSHPEVYAAMGG